MLLLLLLLLSFIYCFICTMEAGVFLRSSLSLLQFIWARAWQNQQDLRSTKTQISLAIRTVWSESSLCAQLVATDPTLLHADNEDSDQNRWMPRLIRVFAGRTDHFVGFVVLQLILGICAIPRIPPVPSKHYADLYIFSNHVIWDLMKKSSSYFLQNNSHKYATDQRMG